MFSNWRRSILPANFECHRFLRVNVQLWSIEQIDAILKKKVALCLLNFHFCIEKYEYLSSENENVFAKREYSLSEKYEKYSFLQKG